MQIIANFSYAGTGKFVSHAVDGDFTVCGMATSVLFARSHQEWEEIDEENYLGYERKHRVDDVGCLSCKRFLTKRAFDKGYAPEKIASLPLEVLSKQSAESLPPFANNANRWALGVLVGLCIGWFWFGA